VSGSTWRAAPGIARLAYAILGGTVNRTDRLSAVVRFWSLVRFWKKAWAWWTWSVMVAGAVFAIVSLRAAQIRSTGVSCGLYFAPALPKLK
jgi:hypothetical protein